MAVQPERAFELNVGIIPCDDPPIRKSTHRRLRWQKSNREKPYLRISCNWKSDAGHRSGYDPEYQGIPSLVLMERRQNVWPGEAEQLCDPEKHLQILADLRCQ